MDPTTVLLVLLAAGCGAAIAAAVMGRRLARDAPRAAGAAGGVPDPGSLLAEHRQEVRHHFDRMADLVGGLADRQATQHGEMTASVAAAARASAALAESTSELRSVLSSPQARGQWGERLADDVLRLAGLTEGISYRRQVPMPDGTVPDVTFFLPGGLRLNLDVKFPLDNYQRAAAATSASERSAAEAAFVKDVGRRVGELSSRGYVQPGVTVDHVLLFIPNEAVYGFVHERDPTLADSALRQKVVLCSPFTLYAVLGIVRHAVEAHGVARRSDEIFEHLAAFEDQWKRYSDAVDVLGRRFDSVHKGFEELAGPRRRQLERRLDRIGDLRVGPASTDDEAHGGAVGANVRSGVMRAVAEN